METTIVSIRRKSITTKRGPAISISIKTDAHGDKWLSSFGDDVNKGWNDGDVVEIDITENGEYLNFKAVKTISKAPTKEDRIEAMVDKKGDGMAVGNAKTNAVSLVVAMVNKGILKEEKILPAFKKLTKEIYNYTPCQ